VIIFGRRNTSAGSCASSRPVNLTSDRGLIKLSLTSTMSRSSSKAAAAAGTLQFDCRWLIQPSTDDAAVVLQFPVLRVFAPAASPSTASSSKSSSCSQNFVEVRVGRNLVSALSCFVLLFYAPSPPRTGKGHCHIVQCCDPSVRPSVCPSHFLILSRSLDGGMRASPLPMHSIGGIAV